MQPHYVDGAPTCRPAESSRSATNEMWILNFGWPAQVGRCYVTVLRVEFFRHSAACGGGVLYGAVRSR